MFPPEPEDGVFSGNRKNRSMLFWTWNRIFYALPLAPCQKCIDYKGKKIKTEGLYFCDKKMIQLAFSEYVDSIEKNATHELAHHLNFELLAKSSNYTITRAFNRLVGDRFIDDNGKLFRLVPGKNQFALFNYMHNCKRNEKAKDAKFPTAYSQSNALEFVAECMAEYYHGDKIDLEDALTAEEQEALKFLFVNCKETKQ